MSDDSEVHIDTLKAIMLNEQITLEETEVDRLRVELITGGARFFREPTGRLTRVRDYIQLRVLNPTRDGFLIKETKPRGFPTGLRNCKETIMAAARRVANQTLPRCVSLSIELQEFHKDDGVWIEPVTFEEGTMRTSSRTFVVQATFQENPNQFALVQAGLLDY